LLVVRTPNAHWRAITSLGSVVVLGTGLVLAAPPAAATAALARPTVSNVTPGSGAPSQGNWVTITGSGFTAASTVTFGLVRGGTTRVASATRINVRAPAHSLGTFYVHVTTSAGRSAAGAGNRYVFTRPLPSLRATEHTFGTASGLSCPTTSFCLIVERSGDAVTFGGSTVGPPQPTGLNAASSYPLQVACTSATFCAATSAAQASTFNGTTWSSAQNLTGTPFSVGGLACASPTFCVAGGSPGRWYRFNGTTWTRATLPGAAAVLQSIACASPTLCVAADFAGHTWRWDGHHWIDQGDVLGASPTLAAMSCASASKCVAIYTSGTAATLYRVYNGTSWGASQPVGTAFGSASELSCAAGPDCVALDNANHVARYDGTAWTVTDLPPPGEDGAIQVAVSCATSTQCRVIDTDGRVRTLSGTAWGASVATDPGPRHIDSVSCPTARFCAAVDNLGFVITYDGSRWAAPERLESADHLTSVSCPTARSCVAVDDAGRVSRFNGSSWSALASIDTHAPLASVSCPNSAFCMAVDRAGFVVAYSNSRWHTPRRLVTLGGLAAVSCASAVFCWTVGLDGYAARYTGSWGATHKIANDALTSVSCSSSKYCVVGTQDDGVRTYSGQAWGRNIRFFFDSDTGGGRVESVSCVSARFCSVAYSNSDELTAVTLDGAATTYQSVNLDFSDFPGFVATSCWAAGRCMVAGGRAAVALG
jgi:hypothetical protein